MSNASIILPMEPEAEAVPIVNILRKFIQSETSSMTVDAINDNPSNEIIDNVSCSKPVTTDALPTDLNKPVTNGSNPIPINNPIADISDSAKKETSVPIAVDESPTALNQPEVKEPNPIPIVVYSMESSKPAESEATKSEIQCQTPNHAGVSSSRRESNNLTKLFIDQSEVMSQDNEVQNASPLKEQVKDIQYYRNLVEINTQLLNNCSSKWTSMNDDPSYCPPEDVQGDIRSACGLAKLLIDERFDQFNDLIRLACEYTASLTSPANDSSDIKVVLTSDLEGFWEMIEIQVKDVENKFRYLEKLKENKYEPLPVEAVVVEVKPVLKRAKAILVKEKPESNSNMKDVVKKPKQPSFASFRFNLLKSNLAKKSEDFEVVINVPNPNPPIVQSVAPSTPQACIQTQTATPKTDTRRRSSRLLGLNPTPISMNENMLHAAKTPARKTNQRRSDLIKWDDTPQKPGIAVMDAMREENETESSSSSRPAFSWLNDSPCVTKVTKRKEISNGKENPVKIVVPDEEDFLSFDDMVPMKLSSDVKGLLATPSYNDYSTSTYAHRKSLSVGNRQSLTTNKSVINSPLLKMAFISSNGKRVSTTHAIANLNNIL
jgi:hypothetical protein